MNNENARRLQVLDKMEKKKREGDRINV